MAVVRSDLERTVADTEAPTINGHPGGPTFWRLFGGVESTGTLHGNGKSTPKIHDFPLETPEKIVDVQVPR